MSLYMKLYLVEAPRADAVVAAEGQVEAITLLVKANLAHRCEVTYLGVAKAGQRPGIILTKWTAQ